ncbi:transporter substrate-binding domain-containing protein [Vibrio sp. JC009]|uniref:substrate-binding periplasmic protein n=1 Tax=Vibrio sp. JC009 TaxID=2912314 RepID=UPI0023AFA1BB|nr:transporter substrate-binding domain-containing protein [Vibrio sp. JC009]WED20534.1 transporter substrate-binding domain-containing protein [Vibrio sp. JC009]
MVEEIYRKAGVGISVKALPARRATFEAKEGVRDGEIMRILTNHGAESQLYRIPYSLGDVKTQVYVQELNSQLPIKNLSLYSVAVVRGIRHANTYVKDFPHVIQVDDVAMAIRLLSMGRVDAVVISQLNGEYEIRAQKVKDIVPLSDPVIVQGLYHYINRQHPDVIEKIESTLKSMHESGELKALWKRYAEKELNEAAAK